MSEGGQRCYSMCSVERHRRGRLHRRLGLRFRSCLRRFGARLVELHSCTRHDILRRLLIGKVEGLLLARFLIVDPCNSISQQRSLQQKQIISCHINNGFDAGKVCLCSWRAFNRLACVHRALAVSTSRQGTNPSTQEARYATKHWKNMHNNRF